MQTIEAYKIVFLTSSRSGKFLCLAIGLALSLAAPARANLDNQGFTQDEKAGFAFFALAGSKPDFMAWALHTPEYVEAKREEKQQVLDMQMVHLQQGFQNYNPDDDLIMVESPGELTEPKDTDGDVEEHVINFTIKCRAVQGCVYSCRT